MTPNKRLTAALAPARPRILDGAVVSAVNTSTVDIDLLGVTIADVPYLATGWTPAVDDVVSVVRSFDRLLVLGPMGPGGGGGSGYTGPAIAVATTAPSSPNANDLWVAI